MLLKATYVSSHLSDTASCVSLLNNHIVPYPVGLMSALQGKVPDVDAIEASCDGDVIAAANRLYASM